jgi:hypothetical protein
MDRASMCVCAIGITEEEVGNSKVGSRNGGRSIRAPVVMLLLL